MNDYNPCAFKIVKQQEKARSIYIFLDHSGVETESIPLLLVPLSQQGK